MAERGPGRPIGDANLRPLRDTLTERIVRHMLRGPIDPVRLAEELGTSRQHINLVQDLWGPRLKNAEEAFPDLLPSHRKERENVKGNSKRTDPSPQD